jgi:anti-sigma factor RsiW
MDRDENAADEALSKALERLPRPRAPEALRRAVEARLASPPDRPAAGRPAKLRGGGAAWVVAAAAAVLLAVSGSLAWQARAPREDLVAEAVNDHLRVLYAQRPLEVESGGIHQVKPWFEGRIDFAPVVPFAGDDDFPLQGGAVAYFVDRKAATFVFKRRLHLMTLFVFRADGLPWPVAAKDHVGEYPASSATSRGFHVLLWRANDLGYALVSDVNEADVRALAEKISSGP